MTGRPRKLPEKIQREIAKRYWLGLRNRTERIAAEYGLNKETVIRYARTYHET